jgi:hypothetical protein
MNSRSRTLLAAALAGMLAAPAVFSAEEEKKKDEGQPCWGINKCKGLGDCGAEGCRTSGCHGSNGCKGKGFLRLPADSCLKIQGGRLEKAAAAKTAKKTEATKG